MTAATVVPAAASRTLEYLPVGLFGSVMGLAGLSIAWRMAEARYGWPEAIANAIAVLAVAAFVVMGVAYAVKAWAAPDAVTVEFRHPISGNLFGLIFISLLLLPIVIAPFSLAVARTSWVVGAVGMLVFAWLMVDRWMSDRQQVAHATPAWVVPVVGMLDVPLAIPSLELQPLHAVMVPGLAIGLFFAIPIFTLVFSRLVFEPPLPDALQPSLLILLAPFAVGTSAYITTSGQVDLFAECLYALTLFMLAVLVGRLRYLGRCCPFRLSWWAVSFPLAASAIAAFRIAQADRSGLMDAIALFLLALATVVIAGLLLRTLMGIAKGELQMLTT